MNMDIAPQNDDAPFDPPERPNDVIINDRVRIPAAALSFRFARSGGPGGQHTNKTESNVELMFDVVNTPALSEAEKTLVIVKLASYLDKDGVLHLESQQGRSQFRNREEVVTRFANLLRQALIVPKKRRATKPSRAAKEQRLAGKKRASATKKMRRDRNYE